MNPSELLGVGDVSPSELTAHCFSPATRIRETPLVAIHGRRTNPAHMLRALRPYAALTGTVVIAPDFRGAAFKGYQTLRSSLGDLGAAQALERLLERLRPELVLPRGPLDLIGYSAGAQFAHRFALMFPDRVRRLVTAAAGWYTSLDPRLPFPHGLAGEALGRLPQFLEIPVMVAVGDLDVHRDGGLRSEPGLDARQGANRRERALRWSREVRSAAADRGIPSRLELAILGGVGHSWSHASGPGGLAEMTFEFLARDAG